MVDVFVAGGGLIFVAAGMFGILSSRRLARNGQRVTGTVVAVQRTSGADGATYRPVLGFRTLDGQDMRVTAKTSGRPPTGKQVPVVYDPRRPTNAEIDTWAGRGTPLLVIITGLGVCLLGYALFMLAAG